MKTYPKGTTAAQWIAYNIEKKEFLEMMEANRPDPRTFENANDYNRANSEWCKELAMNFPNEPGYYRANND